MKILLVRPPRIKQAITLSDFMFSEPLGLEMIYGVIKEDHEVEIYDMMIEKESLTIKLKEYSPDTVGITSLCIDVFKVLDLAREVKEYNEEIVTIVGGTQSYLNPLAFKDINIDHIFKYTNRENIKGLFKKKDLDNPIDGVASKKFDYKLVGQNLRNEYLLPDRESTRKYREYYSYFGYRPAAIMEFGLGCEKSCDFCLRWRIEGRQEKLIDLDLIRKDLSSIKEPTIMFFDNDFLGNQEKIDTLTTLVEELKLKKNYIIYASVEGIIKYKKELSTLKNLGLKAVLVGYESFSNEEMKSYRKKSSIEDNLIAAKILKDLDIDAWASFMAHPDWDQEDFKSLRKYIKSLKPEISSISPLTPFPNLPMFNRYKDRLIYDIEDYEKWSFGQVIIRPSKISLRRYYYELLKTNLYVNLISNKKTEMLRHYGLGNIFLILKGSSLAVYKYSKLMISYK